MSHFTVVSYKKKRRGRKNLNSEFDEELPYYFNKLKQKSIQARTVVVESKIFTTIKSLIGESLEILQLSSIKEIVCYGLGSFSECNNAMYQYGLLLELKDFLSCEVLLYDPIFKEVEKNILVDAGCCLIEENEQGKRKIVRTTLFYLPHCPNELLNNIISINLDVNLSKCIILSNSISEIYNNKTNKQLQETLPFVLKAAPFVTEMAIQNTFKYLDVFNDISVHIFLKDKCLILTEQNENVNLENMIESLTIT